MSDDQKIVTIITTHSARYTMSANEVDSLVELIAKELTTDWKNLKAAVLARLKPNAS